MTLIVGLVSVAALIAYSRAGTDAVDEVFDNLGCLLVIAMAADCLIVWTMILMGVIG